MSGYLPADFDRWKTSEPEPKGRHWTREIEDCTCDACGGTFTKTDIDQNNYELEFDGENMRAKHVDCDLEE